MKRPSMQFYPADWRNNTKLQRASFAERGVWVEVMCLMHDSDEYGVLRWPLKDIARVVGCRQADLQSLAKKGILKGSDTQCEEFTYTPRHAGKNGATETLIPAQPGPLWYSSRMVVDEHLRGKRGASTRFTSTDRDGETPNTTPKYRQGEPPNGTPTARQGDGATTTSSTTSSEVLSTNNASANASTRAEAEVRACLEKHNLKIAGMWPGIWAEKGFTEDRLTKAIAIASQRLKGEEIHSAYLDKVLTDEKNFVNGASGNGRLNGKPWFATNQGIDEKGAALGVTPDADEAWPVYRDRVIDKAGARDDFERFMRARQ